MARDNQPRAHRTPGSPEAPDADRLAEEGEEVRRRHAGGEGDACGEKRPAAAWASSESVPDHRSYLGRGGGGDERVAQAAQEKDSVA